MILLEREPPKPPEILPETEPPGVEPRRTHPPEVTPDEPPGISPEKEPAEIPPSEPGPEIRPPEIPG